MGTDQTIAMLGIGCTLGRQDFVNVAVARLRASISRVIDAQGANNEQSVGSPDGTQARLGDTTTKRLDATRSPAQAWVASNGASGAPPAKRVSVYAAGYVFGRSGASIPQLRSVLFALSHSL